MALGICTKKEYAESTCLSPKIKKNLREQKDTWAQTFIVKDFEQRENDEGEDYTTKQQSKLEDVKSN